MEADTDRFTIHLAYGSEGLDVDFPAGRTTVIEPAYRPGLTNEAAALRHSLRQPIAAAPLRHLAGPRDRVAISVCDVTRPMPTSRVLPLLLSELDHVDRDRITILVATGTHRASTRRELQSMVGSEILDQYRVIDHNCRDASSLTFLGSTSTGIPIYLNRHWTESDVRITTGFVEPHFFAGFSGGPKLVAPGLAGLETVMGLHSARLIGDPMSTWGELQGNPLHREIREIAERTGVQFGVDVIINRDRKITGVFAGDITVSHPVACEACREAAMQEVEDEFEVVVTTNSGYPLDLNLYQSVKGMSAAARAVRKGGTIVCAAECRDGVPEHGRYGELLASSDGPADILRKVNQPGFSCPDQWQVQVQALIQQKAQVYLKSSGLSPDQVRAAHLEPVEDIAVLVEERLLSAGPEARVCVLPEGPQTIPFIRSRGGHET